MTDDDHNIITKLFFRSQNFSVVFKIFRCSSVIHICVRNLAVAAYQLVPEEENKFEAIFPSMKNGEMTVRKQRSISGMGPGTLVYPNVFSYRIFYYFRPKNLFLIFVQLKSTFFQHRHFSVGSLASPSN